MEKSRLKFGLILAIGLILAGALAIALNNESTSNLPDVAVNYTYRIVNTYPHDTSAFTQGLLFSDGTLYESTGGYGKSSLRQVELTTGNVLMHHNLPDEYFAEGLTLVNDQLIQLTWLNSIGFVYDKETFGMQRNFSVSGQGWGLTYDGTNLIMSNGSDSLIFLDPKTYAVTGQVSVRDGDTPVTNINELEYINGDVYANIWFSDKIAIINPQTGQVKGWIDLTGIYQPSDYDSVLNGIAYDAKTGKLFVTGKNWPHLYEIEIIPQ